MQENLRTANAPRVGIDLAAFVVLAVIAGMVAAMMLAGIAILLTGAASAGPEATPVVPQSPAARTMLAARAVSQQ